MLRFTPAPELLELVRDHVEWAEAARRPAQPVMDAFAAAGLLRLLAPASYGGGEATMREFVEVIEQVAGVDGSAGWTLMTCNEEIEIAAGYLPGATMSALLHERPAVIVAGSGAALGRARPEPGGWRLSGRWPFVTGGPAAHEIVVCAQVDEPKPRRLCFALLPAEQVTILDTWTTAGLRGTGSHDVTLDDVFVPEPRTGIVASGRVTMPDAALFRLPPALRFPFPKVGVAAGIARHAIDAFVDLAGAKKARVSRTLLCDRPDAQLAMAEAEALLGSGRAFAFELIEEVWSYAVRAERVPRPVHARARLACSHAVASCVKAVETLCTAAGTTANLAGSPLERCLRDVRAVPQHVMVGGFHALDAGRVLLGLGASDPAF
ncbi:MAG: acyl-CoA dehydrogenase family protein [Acidimicrobiales bacterium]